MKRLTLEPNGWPCTLAECPAGAFIHSGEHLGFKTEYNMANDHRTLAYNEAGECFCAGDDTIVQPVDPVWSDDEA